MDETGAGQAEAPRPRRRQARGDRTRAALIEAALELFGRQGVDDTSVDQITGQAAVAKGTFYVHFERKQDVLLEVAAQLVHDVAPVVPQGPPGETLLRMGDDLAQVLGRLPRPVAGRMIREVVGNRDKWLRVLGDRPTLSALIRPVIEQGQEDDHLRTDQSPARLSQALTILWLDGVVGWAERSRQRPLRRDVRLATELFLDGAVDPAKRSPEPEA